MSDKKFLNRTAQEWLSTLPLALLLMMVILFSTGELIHSQLLGFGSKAWQGYHEIRNDPQQPNCVLITDIESQVQQRLNEQKDSVDDEFDFFREEPLSEDAIRASLINAQQSCQDQYAAYNENIQKITPGVKVYREFEKTVAKLGDVSLHANRYIMLLLLLVTAITTTILRDHIALRPVRNKKDLKMSLGAQLIGNMFLFISAIRYNDMQKASGIPLSKLQELAIWFYIIGFCLLVLVTIWQIFKIPEIKTEEGGSFFVALLSIPLFSYMAIISGIAFFLENHYTGMIIYLNKMMDLSGVFINLGLYVWVGMLLKQTNIASLVFDTFRPWKMPPEILAFFAILVSALPTAYTGGSAIYVIAAGAVIYNELQRVGARRQLALATTAISGSMGIVLRPCLMIVLIAALNKEVTTSGVGDITPFDFDVISEWGLYTAGFWLFFLTATIFLIITLLTTRNKIRIASPVEALPQMIKLLKPLVPYALVIMAVVLFYRWVLDAKMDEFSAPTILPVVLLFAVIYDQFRRKRLKKDSKCLFSSVEGSVRQATSETTTHIGALLMLMGMSICLGGLFEGDMTATSLQTGDNLWLTVGMLVVILVGIGMFMDPMGAIILVSITLAKFAYDAGVHPLHFWMITLMAFELGYLTPPVALNHLMTRHVVGEEEYDLAREESKGLNFYQRYERILLPIAVMASSLLITAFVPLIFYA